MLDRPLGFGHPAGTTVVRVPAEYAGTYERARAASTSTVTNGPDGPEGSTEGASSDGDGSGGVPLLLIIVGIAALGIAVLVGLVLPQRHANSSATSG